MTTASQPETKARPKRRIRLFWIMLIGPAVIVLLLAVAALWYNYQLQSQIEEELDKIAARGEPISAADLQADYAMPAEARDRTDDWLEVITRMKAAAENPKYQKLPIVGTGEGKIPYSGNNWADDALVTTLMNDLQPTFAKLDDLRENPGQVRFPHKFSDGFAMLPNVQQIRNVARVLSLRARWQVYHGDSQGALESLIGIRRAAQTLEHEPIMVSQLVRIACNGMMLGDTLELLPHANWSEAQLQQLQQELLADDHRQMMVDSVMGERALGLEVFNNPEQIGVELSTMYRFTRKADQLYYLQLYGRMVEASEQPYAEAQAEFDRIEQEMQAESTLQKIQHPLTTLLVPAMSAMRKATGRASVADRAAATLIACERYRLAQGSYPTKLDDLVPEFLDSVPLDAYDGQPLRYLLKADEVVVYSVGDDLTDNGGQSTEKSAYQEPDMTWRLKTRPDGNDQ